MAKYEVEITDIKVDLNNKFDMSQYPTVGFYKIQNDEIVFYDGSVTWVAPAMGSFMTPMKTLILESSDVAKEDVAKEDVEGSVSMSEGSFLKLAELLHNKPK